jgi:hypothetical protein
LKEKGQLEVAVVSASCCFVDLSLLAISSSHNALVQLPMGLMMMEKVRESFSRGEEDPLKKCHCSFEIPAIWMHHVDNAVYERPPDFNHRDND